MPARAGFLTLPSNLFIFAWVITTAGAGLSVQAAEAVSDSQPPKPIIRHLKHATPLPAYSGRPANSASDRGRSAASRERRAAGGLGPAGQMPANPRFASGTAGSEARPAARLRMPLEGSVVMNVPKTPEDVAAYLMHMRSIIHDYERVAVDTLIGGGGISISPASIEASRGQSLELIRRIRLTTPPAELTVAHNQLADTMAAVGDFLERPGGAAGGGLSALTQLQPLLGRLHGSLDRYHSGVSNCIAYYGLSPDLDPFHGEDEDAKQRLTGALQGMTGSLVNPPATSTPSAGKEANGALPNVGAGIGGLGGVDLNALQGLLGGMNAGALPGGSGSTAGLGALGGADVSKLGALDRLGNSNMDLKSLGNLGGQELDVLKQLMGPADASGASVGLQLDGQTAETLMNALKQLGQ